MIYLGLKVFSPGASRAAFGPVPVSSIDHSDEHASRMALLPWWLALVFWSGVAYWVVA